MFGPRRPDYTGCARPRRKRRVHARARNDDAQPAFDRHGASRCAGALLFVTASVSLRSDFICRSDFCPGSPKFNHDADFAGAPDAAAGPRRGARTVGRPDQSRARNRAERFGCLLLSPRLTTRRRSRCCGERSPFGRRRSAPTRRRRPRPSTTSRRFCRSAAIMSRPSRCSNAL